MRRSSTHTVLVLLAALFATSGCGDDATDEEPGPRLQLVIGNSLPLSGDLDSFGPSAEKSGSLAIEVIRDAIVEAGGRQKVDLVNVDNGGGTDSEQASGSAKRLVEDHGASCIVGPWATTDTVRTAEEVAVPAQTPLISPAAPGNEITELDDEDLVYRVALPDSLQGLALAEAIGRDLGAPQGATVNIGARDDAYGNGIAERFEAAWEELGGEIGHDVRYDATSGDLATSARRIAAGEPDATLIVEFPESYAILVPQLSEVGSFDPAATWATDGLALGSVPESLDASAVDGLRGTAPGIPDTDETTQSFVERFEDTRPTDVAPQTFDAHVFDAVVLCYLAAYAAGSGDGADLARSIQAVSAPPGDAYGWEDLADAMRALAAGEEIDYHGASGSIDLDDAGDPTTGTYDIYRYSNRRLELVDEVPVAAE